MMRKVIIFDMDGVIVDSEYTFLSSKTQMLLDRGIDTDETYQYQFMGTTFKFMWQFMKKDCQLEESVENLILEMNDRREQIISRDGIRPIKGAVSFVKKLQENHYRLAVASSSPKSDILKNLTELGIIDAFEITVSGEEVEHSKPEPDIFLKAATLMNVKAEECIVFEDTQNGSRAAKAAQMTCIGFANPDYPAQDLSSCDAIVTDYCQAYKILEQE